MALARKVKIIKMRPFLIEESDTIWDNSWRCCEQLHERDRLWDRMEDGTLNQSSRSKRQEFVNLRLKYVREAEHAWQVCEADTETLKIQMKISQATRSAPA